MAYGESDVENIALGSGSAVGAVGCLVFAGLQNAGIIVPPTGTFIAGPAGTMFYVPAAIAASVTAKTVAASAAMDAAIASGMATVTAVVTNPAFYVPVLVVAGGAVCIASTYVGYQVGRSIFQSTTRHEVTDEELKVIYRDFNMVLQIATYCEKLTIIALIVDKYASSCSKLAGSSESKKLLDQLMALNTVENKFLALSHYLSARTETFDGEVNILNRGKKMFMIIANSIDGAKTDWDLTSRNKYVTAKVTDAKPENTAENSGNLSRAEQYIALNREILFSVERDGKVSVPASLDVTKVDMNLVYKDLKRISSDIAKGKQREADALAQQSNDESTCNPGDGCCIQ